MVKKINIFAFLMIFFSLAAFSQKEAEAILNKLSKTISGYNSLYFEYTLRTEDLQLSTSNMQDGKVLAKGNKYRVSTKDADIYSDGITQWQYLKDANEVVIFSADTESDDFMTNPIGFITGNRDEFKQSLKGEVDEDGLKLTQIDFYPKDIKKPYSYIRVRINEQKQQPYSIRYVGKDGVNYTIKIKNYLPNVEAPKNEDFIFIPENYPDIVIEDLRE